MKPEEFRKILNAAIGGDHTALGQILELYMPLINHASTFDGRLDEDCRQYIMIHIVQNIGKFII